MFSRELCNNQKFHYNLSMLKHDKKATGAAEMSKLLINAGVVCDRHMD